MTPLAHERLDDDGQVIFDLLVEYDGELPFWDKSSPEAINKKLPIRNTR
ncbi:hypothetical protein [Staphylococcus aureus]